MNPPHLQYTPILPPCTFNEPPRPVYLSRPVCVHGRQQRRRQRRYIAFPPPPSSKEEPVLRGQLPIAEKALPLAKVHTHTHPCTSCVLFPDLRRQQLPLLSSVHPSPHSHPSLAHWFSHPPAAPSPPPPPPLPPPPPPPPPSAASNVSSSKQQLASSSSSKHKEETRIGHVRNAMQCNVLYARAAFYSGR